MQIEKQTKLKKTDFASARWVNFLGKHVTNVNVPSYSRHRLIKSSGGSDLYEAKV